MTILFVDDNDFGMKPYRQALQEAGFRLVVASSPEGALEALKSNSDSIKLVILDVLMPTGDIFSSEETSHGLVTGYRLLEKIRETHPRIPVLFLSITNPSEMKSEHSTDNVTFLEKSDTLPAELVTAVKDKLI